MRRFHNPRYAPESLERKLSPSGFVAPVPVAAEVHVPSHAPAVSTPTAPVVASPSKVAAAPVVVSLPKAAPVVHAVALVSTTQSSAAAVGEPGQTQPGDPEPVSPAKPSGGTDPEPPSGSGDPPPDSPSIPGGTDLPGS